MVDALIIIFHNLDLGIVLSDRKVANVTLSYKGIRGRIENHCPVNLTSVVGKILASIMKDVIPEHPETRFEQRYLDL